MNDATYVINLQPGEVLCVKVDVDAAKSNGMFHNEPRDNYIPAIIAVHVKDGEWLREWRCKEVILAKGTSRVYQDDEKFGCIDRSGRAARVWVEYTGDVVLHDARLV